MTTLEIKRLDTVSATSNGGLNHLASPAKSFSPATASPASPNRITKISYVKSDEYLASSPPPRLPHNGDLSASVSPAPSVKETEIPISIIKSQSYGTLTAAPSPVKVNGESSTAAEPTTPNRSRNLSVDNNQRPSSAASNSNRQSTTSNLNKLEPSDLNISTGDVNNSDLRFNKYGFIDKSDPAQPTATLTKTRASKSDAQSTASAPASQNLKDYLQNTDVEQFAEHTPLKVIREREAKWMKMLGNYDEWMRKRFKKVKSRCRKGIPQSVRSRAWMYLTGAVLQKESRPGYFAQCLENKSNVDITRAVEDIKKDLHRQFPSHELFIQEKGRIMLFNVLKAYAVHNKEVGYCQAQGPIAALLLMHMPEEDAFWMLISISDVYLKEYFKPGLEKVQIDGQALFYLFRKENDAAHRLLVKQGIDPILYMTEWFMCVYARTLPWCTVLRVWDMFFCEGIKVLYKVGLYLMLNAFGTKEKMKRCGQQGMYETLNCLRNLPIECLDEVSLVQGVTAIDFDDADFNKAFEKSRVEFEKQMKKPAQARASDAAKPSVSAASSFKSSKKKK